MERATALVDEAARASGVRLAEIVDDVRYVQGSSYFDVNLAGKRVLYIGSNAFDRTHAGQLLEAAHEIVHAQWYNTIRKARNGNFVKAYEDFFEALPFGCTKKLPFFQRRIPARDTLIAGRQPWE